MKSINQINTLLVAMLIILISACGQSKETAENKEAGSVDQVAQTESPAVETSEPEADFSAIDDEQAASILDAYLELKDALVSSSSELAKQAAREIANILGNKAESKQLKDILNGAAKISETDELEVIREHFDGISENVYTLVKNKNTGKTVYKLFCPMAFNNEGAFWISSEDEIRNPYFGDKMLKCGSLHETIAASTN